MIGSGSVYIFDDRDIDIFWLEKRLRPVFIYSLKSGITIP